MKKPIYLFAVLLFTLVLPLLACSGAGEREEETVTPCPTSEPVEETPDIEAAFCRATVHYISDEGFIVPVTKLIPWEEGIGRAVLSLMISTPENLSAAREMGLKTVIPEGASVSLSIADGNAAVDIQNLTPLSSKEEEIAMIQSIVNTLTAFPTVNTVTVTRSGSSEPLENGGVLPVRSPAYPLNPEDPELAVSAGGSFVTLWFPNRSGALDIPVTKAVSGEPTLYSVASALVSGVDNSALLRCFPKDTLLLGAALENGVLTLNLSEDFASVAETEGLFSLAYRSAVRTLSPMFDFTKLRFQVNGRDFAPESASFPGDINPVPGK